MHRQRMGSLDDFLLNVHWHQVYWLKCKVTCIHLRERKKEAEDTLGSLRPLHSSGKETNDCTRYDHSWLRQSLALHMEGLWTPMGSLTFEFSEVMELRERVSVNHKVEFLVLLQKWLGDLGDQESETLSELLNTFTSDSLWGHVFCPQPSLHPLLIPSNFSLFS